MSPIRSLLKPPRSAFIARQKEEALALRAYEAMMAWHLFRKQYWELLEPLRNVPSTDGLKK